MQRSTATMMARRWPVCRGSRRRSRGAAASVRVSHRAVRAAPSMSWSTRCQEDWVGAPQLAGSGSLRAIPRRCWANGSGPGRAEGAGPSGCGHWAARVPEQSACREDGRAEAGPAAAAIGPGTTPRRRDQAGQAGYLEHRQGAAARHPDRGGRRRVVENGGGAERHQWPLCHQNRPRSADCPDRGHALPGGPAELHGQADRHHQRRHRRGAGVDGSGSDPV